MSDTNATPPADSAPATTSSSPQGRRYFNRGQLESLDTADSVLAAARSHPEEMTGQDLDVPWLDRFEDAIGEARGRANDAGQGGEVAKQSTAAARKAAAGLVTVLKRIQSAAKQKHQMLAEDGDPETNFPTDGYLIGIRLDASRAILLQSTAALLIRATADSLPGFKTPEKIQAVRDLLKAYTDSEGDQQDTNRDKELSRLDRDTLLNVINTRRAAIQHAADALWPATEEASRPVRKTFSLPLNRAMGL